MSGHSKWQNIKIRKQAQDAKKSKVFAKLSREIIVAAKEGGGDPDSTNRLRLAIERGRAAGLPQDNVKRAIQRGTGDVEGMTFESAVYEGYAPGGVAVMVQILTDNRNRAVSELRSIFGKHGGNLGEANCVAWLFARKGIIIVPQESASEERVLEIVSEAGAEDVQADDSSYEISTAPEDLERVKKALEENDVPFESAEVTMVPQNRVTLAEKQAQQVLRLMDALEEQDDVQQVYANFDIPDRIMEAIAA